MNFLKRQLKYFAVFLISFLSLGLLPFFTMAQETDDFTCDLKAPIIEYCFNSQFVNSQFLETFLYPSIAIISLFLFFASVLMAIFLHRKSDKAIGDINEYFFQGSPINSPKLEAIRIKLLSEVETEINLRLSQSLHELVKIDLSIGDCLNLIEVNKRNSSQKNLASTRKPSFWNRMLMKVFGRGEEYNELLEPREKIIDVLYRNDVQGKLLILGQPGSGKTTELLHLAYDLVIKAKQNTNLPIPIIFELSSWIDDGQNIDNWLIQYLIKQYKLDKDTANNLLFNNRLVPLLDGLDELGPECQRQCIKSINKWISKGYISSLVVCCRLEEYEQVQEKLTKLNHAIYLESLSNNQIKNYLYDIGKVRLWKDIKKKQDLLVLASKPLFLALLVISHQKKKSQM